MNLFTKLTYFFYLPKLRRLEVAIGYKLKFNKIPSGYIQAVMSCEMTETWKRYGLNVAKGLNHFTMGKVVNGTSTRFDPKALEYQSWIGGYTFKLNSEELWTSKDHFKFAIADQNSWLRRYGDPSPDTVVQNAEPKEVGIINLGKHTGTLYELQATTHSDVGIHRKSLSLLYGMYGMAALYNLANPNLELEPGNFAPQVTNKPFENLELGGYYVIFNLKPRVKMILYANGVINNSSKFNTFERLKDEFLDSFRSCEILEI